MAEPVSFPAWPLISALLGAWAGYYLRGREIRRAETMARLDDIAKQTEDLVKAAREYWSKRRTSDDDPANFIALEAEILGRLHLIAKLAVAVEERIGSPGHVPIDDGLRSLRQALTLGEFKSEVREADPARLQAAFAAAGDLVAACRSVGLRFLRGDILDYAGLAWKRSTEAGQRAINYLRNKVVLPWRRGRRE